MQANAVSKTPQEIICKKSFVDAMYARVKASVEAKNKELSPEAKARILEQFDDEHRDGDVQENLGALGVAVCKILLAKSGTISTSNTDEDFWVWMNAVNAHLQELSLWKQSVAKALHEWTPTNASDLHFKEILEGLLNPPHVGGTVDSLTVPLCLKGKIEIPIRQE